MADDRVRLRSDSPLARRIVKSFIHFLGSVELAAGVDSEGLEVATQCLTEAFALDSHDDTSNVSLVDLVNSAQKPPPVAVPQVDTVTNGVYDQFMDGLESAGFFQMPTEKEVRLSQAKSVFEETLKSFKGSNQSDLLAEAFKAQGNASLSAQRYAEAVELYTLAISMCSSNAIYFANRAAAHTQAGNASAAIMDCHRAIEINPRYSKAYGRLGLVHYSEARYAEAVKWFTKALEVDPSNTSALDNLQSAQEKLDEMNRNTSANQPGVEADPGTTGEPPHFEAGNFSGCFDAGAIPAGLLDTVSEMFDANAQPQQQPGLMNFMQMFGGQNQQTNPQGSPSVAPQEIAERVQSALQSVLGQHQNPHASSQQH